jgi:adenine-specific DNA methylase
MELKAASDGRNANAGVAPAWLNSYSRRSLGLWCAPSAGQMAVAGLIRAQTTSLSAYLLCYNTDAVGYFHRDPESMERRELGIFYTPSEATRILCNWAIRTPVDLVLEPSFGACGFLEASRSRLGELESANPTENLFGCDIDPRAFSEFLIPKFGGDKLSAQFKNIDFLSISPAEFPVNAFDAVIGNPPYVSHHNIPALRKKALADLMGVDIPMDCKASLWAYFIVHSLKFLKAGGRIAWILPSSFLHADYSREIRHRISERFERTLVIQLGQRLFASEGTEESTAVLLAEGWKSRPNGGFARVDFAETLLDLERTIGRWQSGEAVGRKYDRRLGHALMDEEAVRAVEFIERSRPVKKLGDLAEVLIGIVTGANDFFVINEGIAREWTLPESCLRPILSKASLFEGIKITSYDLKKASKNNVRCLLLDTEEIGDDDLPLRVYLWSFPEDRKFANCTFGKRRIWHRPDDGRIPHAFFPYVLQYGPSLILNVAKTTCTNSVHRIFFNNNISTVEMRAAAISVLSTYSQLSAEVEGRTYGVGALKLEPSDAKRIKIILPRKLSMQEVKDTFKQIDRLTREGKRNEATTVADAFVMGRGSSNKKILDALRRALQECRKRRYEAAKLSKTVRNNSWPILKNLAS